MRMIRDFELTIGNNREKVVVFDCLLTFCEWNDHDANRLPQRWCTYKVEWSNGEVTWVDKVVEVRQMTRQEFDHLRI